MYLRCLTSIELYMYAPYYASHPVIEHPHNRGAFKPKANAFPMCLSDVALKSNLREDPCLAILAEAAHNSNNWNYSSFMCLLALSSVVKLPIESYFPIDKTVNTLSIMFNCTIYPREWSTTTGLSDTTRIHIFRCAALPINYLPTREIPGKKDHYVALCKAKPGYSSLTDLNITPELPKGGPFLFPTNAVQKSTEHKQSEPAKSTNPNISMPGVIRSTTKGKGRQAILDNLFKRKRKLPIDTAETLEPPTPFPSKIQQPAVLPSVLERNPCNNAHQDNSAPNDIANFVNAHPPLTEEQKYHVLGNTWKPASTYKFPLNSKGRRFLHQ